MNFNYPEGATLLDEDEKEGLLISHITTRGELNEWEQRNIADAYIWIDRNRNKDILKEDFIKRLHKNMFGKVWKWVGEYRKNDKNIGVDWSQIQIRFRQLLDDTKYWIEIELLTLLIKTWDDEHSEISELDPVQLVKSLMEDYDLTQTDLVDIAGVGKSTISEILNYKKRMSKNVIRNIAKRFKIQQEALNKPYRLEGEGNINEFENYLNLALDEKIDY